MIGTPGLLVPNIRIVSNLSGRILFAMALALFIAARFWHITSSPLSFDEIFSVHAVRHSWTGMINFVRQDIVHPPLFYVLLKLWVELVGEHLLWLRLFSVLFAILSIFPILQLCKELNLESMERNCALILIALNPFLIFYSQQLRMYSLFLFLSLCSLWICVKLFKSTGVGWVPLGVLSVINLLLVFTHYFGWVLVVTEFLVLFRGQKQRLFRLITAILTIAACFSLWVYAVADVYARRGLDQNLGWISRPNLYHLLAFLIALSDRPFDFRLSGVVGVLLFGCPILLWAGRCFLSRDKREKSTFLLLFLFSFVPVAVVFFASFFLRRSIWLPRGLLFVTVPYFMLVVVAASRFRQGWGRLVTLAAVLAWATLAGFKTINRSHEVIGLDKLVHEMIKAETVQSGNVNVYTLDEHMPYAIWFYLSSEGESRFKVIQVKSGSSPSTDYWLTNEMFEAVAIDQLICLKENHFWVVFADKQLRENHTPKEILVSAGYRVGEGFHDGLKENGMHLFPVWR